MFPSLVIMALEPLLSDDLFSVFLNTQFLASEVGRSMVRLQRPRGPELWPGRGAAPG